MWVVECFKRVSKDNCSEPHDEPEEEVQPKPPALTGTRSKTWTSEGFQAAGLQVLFLQLLQLKVQPSVGPPACPSDWLGFIF